MVANITYTKTTRGQRAFIKGLPDAAGQVLMVIDGDLTEEEILAKLHDVSKHAFRDAMTWLLEGGFIRLTDSEPFSFSEPNGPNIEAIQVQEISFDEFDALPNAVLSDQQKKEKTAEAALAFEILAQSSAEKSAKLKKRTKAEKEQARLEAIEKTKRLTAAKAEERARLNAETEMQKQADVLAKKEVWAKLKTEAEEKAAAEKRAEAEAIAIAKMQAEITERERGEAEAKENAEKWAQLKAEAKAKAEEEARLAAIANAKEEIQLQRLSKKTYSKSRIKQWFNALLGMFLSLLRFSFIVCCIVLVAAHFINIPMLVNPIEKVASEKIQDKVNIKSAHIWLFPRPHILLNNITIADTNQIFAEKIRIYPNLISLKNKFISAFPKQDKASYEIQSIKVEGLSIAQKDFAHLATWGRAITNNQQYVLHRLVFEGLALKLNNLSLPTLHADIALSTSDAFEKAVITTKEKNFNLTVHAVNGDYLMDITATNWRVPVSPYPLFTMLSATGVIKNDDLIFSSITGQLYGGKLNAQLQTKLASPQLATQGSVKLKEMAISQLADDLNVNAAVIGTLNSNANFSFNISPSTNKIDTPNIAATFSVQKGVVKKIDIAEAMRTKNINGSTNFTTLAGSASLNNNLYRFSHLFLQDKQLQAYGQVTISADQQVSATVSSTIAIPENPITRDLIIQGPVDKLKLIN
jgi:hypothetical protein